jgi:hypothetical protein
MSIPGSASPLFLTSAAAAAEFQIDRSLRFNSADSAYLNRTPSSAGNSKTFTWSGWVKQVVVSGTAQTHILAAGSSPYFQFYFAGPTLYVETNQGYIQPTRKLRDPSAWYHFVVAIDTTQATATNRIKFYVNGEEVTDFAVDQRSSITQNTDLSINSTVEHRIGRQTAATAYSNMYLAEVHFVDGQQLEPTDFGEFDSNNLWQPKEYSGTYGTNGFYLKFADNSSNAALGTDSSGNGNTWTVNNLSVDKPGVTTTGNISLSSTNRSFYFKGTSGQSITVAAGNFIWDSSDGISWTYRGQSSTSVSLTAAYIFISGTTGITFTNSSSASVKYWDLPLGTGIPNGSGTTTTFNLEAYGAEGIDSLIDTPTNYIAASGNNGGNYATFSPIDSHSSNTFANGNLEATNAGVAVFANLTMGFTSGKWYCEIEANGGGNGSCMVGIVDLNETHANRAYGTAGGCYMYQGTGGLYSGGLGGSFSNTSYGSAYSDGDIIGIGLDMDNGNVRFYINGSDQGQANTSSLAGALVSPAVNNDTNSASFKLNAGQRPFTYTPPTDHLPLVTTSFDDPTIADGSTAMDVVTYSGDGTNGRAITGINHGPDLVWIKARNQTDGHNLFDIVRGTTKVIKSNNSNVELTESNSLTAFNSDGFTVGSNASNAQVNQSGFTYVGWAWDGGSSTSSNSDGSITTNVRANPSAGFSIIGYTGNATVGATIGHGLNSAPEWLVFKNRDEGAGNWYVYHKSPGHTKYLTLDRTHNAIANSFLNNTAPTSSVITLNNTAEVNATGQGIICYAWAPVEGYSAFGSYVGSQNFPFVYCGFRPRFLLIKPYDLASGWQLYDSERNSFNPADDYLAPNEASAEVNSVNNNQFDFLSNGFVPRGVADSGSNYTGYNFLFVAYAEHPFKTARAR